MSLSTVTTGNTILASDVNQLVNVLQRASGQTEQGGYYLNSWSNASTDTAGTWVSSLSRSATPVSVNIDTSVDAPTACNTPSTNRLTANGFHVYTTATAANTNFYAGGLYTIQY